MDHNSPETVEQHAIELVSSLGKEHLFVANCPSDIDANRYSGTVITYEEAFDHSNTGVGLCLLLPKAFVLQKLVDMSLHKDISVHFVFTCPSNTSEFEASAWLYNLLQDRVQHVGFMQNLGITCSNSNQEKYIIACQVEPNAEHCRIAWTHSCKTLEYVFPRPVVERQNTVHELQSLPVVTCIDFRRPNGCHRISDKIDVTSLTVQINSDSLADIELVEKCIQPTIDAAWSHGLAECQVKHFFPWNDRKFQDLFQHGITMSVLDLKSFSNNALLEILTQLAKLKVRYHFMNYKRLAIFGPASLVINLHLALLPINIQLPIGPKQNAFTIHMTRSEPQDAQSTNDGNHFRVKFGKIGSFQYTPAQIVWNEIHPSVCVEDQLVRSPLIKLLSQKFGAVNFSIRWCQVDLSQQKCLCFDIDIKHEETLPVLLNCDLCQVAIQHQCPSAEAFRAEVPLTEFETRRDHWNKVIAQQMIPKEGRVSHVSFEQDKKQSARRYYYLRTTVVDSMSDYTNIITIASQPPAWFFSPKELTLPLRTCLQEINYCDNSFIQESFTMNPGAVEIELRRHEFGKCRDHHKWVFYHIILGPEQCFHFKSVHLERDEWKVRYYDELIIRTFEQASLFIALPPGISVSQVLDKTDFCDLREAFTYADPSQQTPEVSTFYTGMRDQYVNTTPSNHFVNGCGIPSANGTPMRGQPAAAPHGKRPAYCPPSKSRQTKAMPKKTTENDVDMTPVEAKNPNRPEDKQKNNQQETHEHCGDAQMECNATEKDSQANSTHATMQDSQQMNDTRHNAPIANYNLAKTPLSQQNILQPHQNAINAEPSDPQANNGEHPQPNSSIHDNRIDAATMGYPRLAQDHQTGSPDALNTADSAGYPRLISPLPATNSTPQPTPTPVVGGNIHPSIPTTHLTNGTQTIDGTTTNQQDDRSHQTSPTEKKGRQPTRTTNVPTANADQGSGSIKDYLTKNTAFRPIDNHDTVHSEDDDVLFVKATSNINPHSIDSILLRHEQSGNLVNLCKEIISGWPNSFAHADSDYFAKLAACYLIEFPSYMLCSHSASRSHTCTLE